MHVRIAMLSFQLVYAFVHRCFSATAGLYMYKCNQMNSEGMRPIASTYPAQLKLIASTFIVHTPCASDMHCAPLGPFMWLALRQLSYYPCISSRSACMVVESFQRTASDHCRLGCSLGCAVGVRMNAAANGLRGLAIER
eukprot:scpid60448/ scgid18775/ 